MKSWSVGSALAMSSAVVLTAVGACGGGEKDGGGDAGAGSGATSTGASSGTGATGSGATGPTGGLSGAGSTGTGASAPTGCSLPPDDTGCVGEEYEGESIPLDIFVMFDLSCSMSCTIDQQGCCGDRPESEWRIQPVRDAMRAFLQDGASAGIGVGLGFFGDHDLSQNRDPEVCSVEAHSDATVEIQTLPGVANELISALDAGVPQGGTPTHLAINGACTYVADWKQSNPGHKVVILLVTDGIPEYSCNATIERATAAASDCYEGGVGFETYVLGVVANNNDSLDQLNEIAQSGGTDHAYLTNTEDVEGSVLAALNAIRADAAIPCELQIPPPPSGEQINTNMVNLGICDASQQVVVTPRVTDAGACGESNGWYYDDPNSPESIHLCSATCETVSVPGSSLFFSIGCGTFVIR